MLVRKLVWPAAERAMTGLKHAETGWSQPGVGLVAAGGGGQCVCCSSHLALSTVILLKACARWLQIQDMGRGVQRRAELLGLCG